MKKVFWVAALVMALVFQAAAPALGATIDWQALEPLRIDAGTMA